MAVASRTPRRRRLDPTEMRAMMERAHNARPLIREFSQEERWKVLLAIVAPEVALDVLERPSAR